MLAGADFGTALMWVVAVGAILKLGLNEGVARWQLATDTTLLEGWCRHLGWPIKIYFFLYLVVWGFIVAGGLMSACGVGSASRTTLSKCCAPSASISPAKTA